MKTDIKDIYSYKDFTITEPIAFKDIDGKKGIVTGYFADFDSIDSDGDVIKKGAFSRTITATGPASPKPRVKHLLNHDVSYPLGVVKSLKEDNKGLYYESQIGTHSLGTDFIKMAESGLITEHSIGYRTIKYNQIKPWEDWKDGEAARELTELKLYEGSSLTAWGANPNTPLTGLKNEIEINKLINRADAIEKFCRESEATDETIEMLLLYNKQLVQLITDSKSTQPVLTIVPEVVKQELIKVDSVVECPSCTKHTHNTQTDKGYIQCHRCSAVFVYGSKLFIKL